MSKYKDYIYDNAEKEVDSISDDYAKSKIDLDSAVDKIKKVDNYEMIVDEYNIEDALYYAKHDYEQSN